MIVEQNNNRNKAEEGIKLNPQEFKKVEKQFTKGLLDIVILSLLRSESMHGYKIIKSIRRGFGVYFGPSTIYPYLNDLKEKGYIKSQWDTNNDRPRKVYSLTPEGSSILTGAEQSFNSICSRLSRMGMSRLPFNNNIRNNVMSDQVGMQ
jgi:PadR family transcriptional regulator PadR